jgi:hypothetical protein
MNEKTVVTALSLLLASALGAGMPIRAAAQHAHCGQAPSPLPHPNSGRAPEAAPRTHEASKPDRTLGSR